MVGFRKEALEAANVARRKNNAIRKQQALEIYAAAPIKCGNIKCDNDLSFLQARGKITYCSRACSCSAVIRLNSSSKEKMRATFAAKVKPKFYECKICKIQFENKKKKKLCSAECTLVARKIAAQKAVQTMRERDSFSGWHNRRGEPSYPEKYFMALFEQEEIFGWKTEKKVGRWFIDFAFEDRKIAVEIDGRQHQAKDRAESDIKKDTYLATKGWHVIRIPWTNPVSDKGKQALYPHVYKLISLLKEK